MSDPRIDRILNPNKIVFNQPTQPSKKLLKNLEIKNEQEAQFQNIKTAKQAKISDVLYKKYNS